MDKDEKRMAGTGNNLPDGIFFFVALEMKLICCLSTTKVKQVVRERKKKIKNKKRTLYKCKIKRKIKIKIKINRKNF